jgi:hypothetical protein
VLLVLRYEADKQQFDEKVFGIFDYILFFDEKNNEKVINILERYTTKKYNIPENTIISL